ncbi:MAG: valine--tRNA ligase [Candidatus Vogelbacteria bacterium]|nr:valine--tRNA ligase [Candidatus Vogelbacteria bacterium]
MNDKLLKPYNPNETEARIYKRWEDSGYFNPDVCIAKGITKPDAPHFSIVLPPPNVTGRLHLGHALEHSLQDAVVRFERMRGKRTVWIPGTDHAAIATQSRFEKELQKESGKSRHDFPREEFFKMINEFGLKNQKDMLIQMRLLGSSLDWSREAFTLDYKRSMAVKTAFKKMYDEGLIYRGNRVINWDPKGQTTIADDEIIYEEREAKFYTFKYSKDFPIPISTTRAETKVGDTAVAVNPKDARYKEYVGKTYLIKDFCGVPLTIKVIADESVEADFGTGALGVTPAHSQIDADIAARHNLPTVQVINEYAKMMIGDERILGKKTTEAREVIVSWLRNQGLLEKEETIKQNISTAERTGGIIEPLPKLQWFIDVNKAIPSKGGKTLKELMREPVASKKINILPDHFEKIYFNWIDNLRDWCISRQIIYGHRIPVWYHELKCIPKQGHEQDIVKCEQILISADKPKCEFCDAQYIQDSDTLDTWFSSGLWTFSTLGWPGQTTDLKTYHPTSLMNPGYEILFFWVARMVMMSEYLLGDIPFKTVYLHGIVRDSKGKKFSKSANNGIEPEEVIKQLGTDALRMSMIVGIGPGNDINFDLQKVKAYSKFANKLWNITRFVVSNLEDFDPNKKYKLTAADTALLEEQKNLAKKISEDMETYKFYLAAENLYHYIWHTFADKIIEESKTRLSRSADNKDRESIQSTLYTILKINLRLLHPFMPFITEELWSIIPRVSTDNDLLLVESWPN